MNRINLYIFSQIVNSCTLVFFIFISVAWLLQLSRLFTTLTTLQINIVEILILSFLIIPNLINITLPFILTFGFVLAFIKLSRDRELIAIFSLGLSLNEIRKPIIFVLIFFTIFSTILGFIFSPNTYSIYKEKEFDLKNSINFEKINLSNFLKFNKNITLDFENKGGKFNNILINIDEINDTIIFAKNGNIIQKKDNLEFILNNGFKIEIKENEIDNLSFDTYVANFPIDEIQEYNKFDPNTLNVIDLINDNTQRSNIIINLRIVDTLILISICISFYFFIIVKNNYSFQNLMIYIISCIICLTFDNLLESIVFDESHLILLSFANILTINIITLLYLIIRKT